MTGVILNFCAIVGCFCVLFAETW